MQSLKEALKTLCKWFADNLIKSNPNLLVNASDKVNKKENIDICTSKCGKL